MTLTQVLILVLAVIAAAIASWTLRPARSEPDEDEPDSAEQLAIAHDTAASEQFRAAMEACRGLPARLTHLATAAEAKGAALREAHNAGMRAAQHRVNPDWRPPWELRRDSPRLPVIAWQRLDRAFGATVDNASAELHPLADAYEQLANAAREVATQLANDDEPREMSSDLARCGFCGKRARDVRKIITGPTNAICDECVDLCVEVLDEDLGDDWRAPSED